MRNLFVGLIGLGTFYLTACGSSSDSGGGCGTASACGGDVVGTWQVSSSCLTVDASSIMGSMSCPGTTTSASGTKITGTVTYSADKTYTSNLTTSGTMVVTLPASCLTQQGVTVTCAQLQQVLNSTMNSTFSSATCTESGGGCACTVTLNAATSNETGTYSTSAGVLTQTDTSGISDDSNYCVQGGKLSLASSSSAMSNGVTGLVVFTKQ